MRVAEPACLQEFETAHAIDPAPRVARLSLLIVDDNRLYRESLADIIARQPEVARLRTAQDEASVRAALETEPDVVLLNLASHSSLDLLALIRSAGPHSRLIVLGASENAEEEIVRCAEAGVAGYLMRSESLEQLLRLINSVVVDETLYSPRVAAVLLRRISTLAEKPPALSRAQALTPRELEILGLLELGLSNREIAHRLFIEIRTVKNHVHSILSKLGVSRRYDAVRAVGPHGPRALGAGSVATLACARCPIATRN